MVVYFVAKKGLFMTTGRRSFTEEVKCKAASLVVDEGYTISDASLSMDVGTTAKHRGLSNLSKTG
jgi:transposase-like protein